MTEIRDEICEHCGARMKEWWHRLTPGLAYLFLRAVDHVEKTGTNLVDKNVLFSDSSRSHYNNFNKLMYFGLVAYEENPDGSRVNHHFVITTNGLRFARGEMKMPMRVKTYRNKKIEEDENEVGIEFFRGKYPEFESEFAFDIHNGKVVERQVEQAALL